MPVARHRNDAAFGTAGLSTSSSLRPASLHQCISSMPNGAATRFWPLRLKKKQKTLLTVTGGHDDPDSCCFERCTASGVAPS